MSTHQAARSGAGCAGRTLGKQVSVRLLTVRSVGWLSTSPPPSATAHPGGDTEEFAPAMLTLVQMERLAEKS